MTASDSISEFPQSEQLRFVAGPHIVADKRLGTAQKLLIN
jgi:hypothetical protein